MDISKSTVKVYSSEVLNAAVFFVALTYFARVLGAERIGMFFLFQVIVGLLAIPADFGLRGAAEKRISEGKRPGEIFTTAVLIKLIPLSVIAVLVLLARGFIDQYVGLKVTYLVIITIFLHEYSRLGVRVLSGERRVGETAILRVIYHLVWLGSAAVMYWNEFGVFSLIYGLILGHIALILCCWYKISMRLGQPSLSAGLSLVRYGKYKTVLQSGGIVYSWTDLAVIGLILTQSAVGSYEMAWQVSAFVVLFGRSIGRSIFPEVSNWDAKNDYSKIESIIPYAITAVSAVSIPAFFGAALYAEHILEILFGAEYTVAALAMVILMFEKIFQSAHVILSRLLQGIDRPDLAARATVYSIILNVLLNVVCIYSFGIVGAAIGTAVSFIANTLLTAKYLHTIVPVRINFDEVGWCIAASCVMSMVLFTVNQTITPGSIPALVVLCGAGAAIYGAILMMNKDIRKMSLEQMGNLSRTR